MRRLEVIVKHFLRCFSFFGSNDQWIGLDTYVPRALVNQPPLPVASQTSLFFPLLAMAVIIALQDKCFFVISN